jgi:hypothetical protein
VERRARVDQAFRKRVGAEDRFGELEVGRVYVQQLQRTVGGQSDEWMAEYQLVADRILLAAYPGYHKASQDDSSEDG